MKGGWEAGDDGGGGRERQLGDCWDVGEADGDTGDCEDEGGRGVWWDSLGVIVAVTGVVR